MKTGNGYVYKQHDSGTWTCIYKPCDIVAWRAEALRACLDYGDSLAKRPRSHRGLFLRNMAQVFGNSGNALSRMLIYWAPVPHEIVIDRSSDLGGGTRYAVRRAELSDVPCFHLAEHSDQAILAFAAAIR